MLFVENVEKPKVIYQCKTLYLMVPPFQGKKLVSIVPKPDSEDASSPNMFKSLGAVGGAGLKSDKKCRKVILSMVTKRIINTREASRKF